MHRGHADVAHPRLRTQPGAEEEEEVRAHLDGSVRGSTSSMIFDEVMPLLPSGTGQSLWSITSTGGPPTRSRRWIGGGGIAGQ